MHYYFRLPAGKIERGRSSHNDDVKWDIRAEGGGVVAPPSVHPSGRIYEWVDGHGPETIKPAPKGLWRGEGATVEDEGDSESPRSLLSHLLNNVPAEGGRNNWLTQVAGHYAKALGFEDAFESSVRMAAGQLEPALPEEEIAKLIKSIWTSERAKEGRAVPDVDEAGEAKDDWRRNLVEPTEDNGWLVSALNRILCQVRDRSTSRDDGVQTALKPWMDADIRVLGVIGSGAERAYEVELKRVKGETVQDTLPAETVADPRALNRWLSGYGVSIAPPDEIWPARIPQSARMLRYLEAQEAAAMEAVTTLGWHEQTEAFITHEGVIRKDGAGAHETVRPAHQLTNWAPYRYGHSGTKEAASVLRDVLTFHDETVAAVFGAWWAATLLKPQIHQVSSQFPFMALEATSESGKTTGFFSLMMQLSGYNGGSGSTTRAAFRDSLSAHKSGIVWLDDLDTLETHMELLRQVTVEGTLIKKGTDHHSQVSSSLRAALVVSGENLGMREQKALLDRAILLDVPSPVGRRSVKGDWPQWDDILDLRASHPDLTEYAGSIVELALGQIDMVKRIKELRDGAGRFADKGAVLRLGARILRAILDGDDHGMVELVDQWVADTEDLGQENTLTLKVIPAALSRGGWPQHPSLPDSTRRKIATPVYLEQEGDDVVGIMFSPKLLAQFMRDTYARTASRVESEEALIQQARALKLGGSRERVKLRDEFGRVGDSNVRHWYWRIEGDLKDRVLERSHGGD
jgi:hypothetical protein